MRHFLSVQTTEKMVKEDEMQAFNSVSSEVNKLTKHLDELSQMKAECSEKIEGFESEIKQISEELHIKESRYKFLVETENEFEGYNKAVRILSDHIDKLHAVAKVLLEKEKIDADEFESIFNQE